MAVAPWFHHYSLKNHLVIARQQRDATCVRDFKLWLDTGRGDRKGEQVSTSLYRAGGPGSQRMGPLFWHG
jgi:hypothetical protein